MSILFRLHRRALSNICFGTNARGYQVQKCKKTKSCCIPTDLRYQPTRPDLPTHTYYTNRRTDLPTTRPTDPNLLCQPTAWNFFFYNTRGYSTAGTKTTTKPYLVLYTDRPTYTNRSDPAYRLKPTTVYQPTNRPTDDPTYYTNRPTRSTDRPFVRPSVSLSFVFFRQELQPLPSGVGVRDPQRPRRRYPPHQPSTGPFQGWGYAVRGLGEDGDAYFGGFHYGGQEA